MLPLNLITAVYLPFLVNFLRLKVALPLALVVALKVFLPTLIVTLTLATAFLPAFKVIEYFLAFFLALNVAFLAVILVATGVTFLAGVFGWLGFLSSLGVVLVGVVFPLGVLSSLSVFGKVKLLVASNALYSVPLYFTPTDTSPVKPEAIN